MTDKTEGQVSIKIDPSHVRTTSLLGSRALSGRRQHSAGYISPSDQAGPNDAHSDPGYFSTVLNVITLTPGGLLWRCSCTTSPLSSLTTSTLPGIGQGSMHRISQDRVLYGDTYYSAP